MTNPAKKYHLSIIIPALNEEESIQPLYEKILQALDAEKKISYEILFVDDGSTDNTWSIISDLSQQDNKVKAVKFRSNFGKAAAIETAIAHASGDLIVMMDADLQDDPKEIPHMLAKIEEGYDLVNGWKKQRHDPLEKTLPSKIFNWVTGKVSGLKLHDFNCGFKMFYKKIFDSVSLYGELHRYLPILAYYYGYKVTEIPVEHHARQYGQSKYGIERYIRGFLDLCTVLIVTKYAKRPGHLFGSIGVLLGIASSLILFYLFGVWLFTDNPIGNRPLLLFGFISMIISIQFIFFGLIAEFILCRSEIKGTVRIVSETLNFKNTKK